jgi:hypothetical protein
MSSVISNRAEAHLCPLPKVIVSNLCNRYIKTMPYPINQFPEHMSLFFQRMIFRNPKVEFTYPDHHLRPLFLRELNLLEMKLDGRSG